MNRFRVLITHRAAFLPALLLALLAAPASRAQIGGVLEAYDHFGQAVAYGDFDGDGDDDLAVGVPWEDVGSIAEVGAVNLIYGTASGLDDAGSHFWHQNTLGIADVAEIRDHFGSVLAAGDFDGDGYDDLAVGVSGEDVGSVESAGAVNVIYGSASGLTASGNQFWHQNSSGIADVAETYDYFGSALATGDFDGDGYDDLAVGVPREDLGSIHDAGVVNVIYGSASGLDDADNDIWHLDIPGITGSANAVDQFGAALAAGDFNFNGDGRDDLAVGAPYEDVGSILGAGAVHVIYGSTGGLASAGNQVWHQDMPGIVGGAEEFDNFGDALATGDFNSDGFGDLVVGVPREDVYSIEDGGAVHVIYGTASGLDDAGNQDWHQESPGIAGVAEADDAFGRALASGDFDGDGYDDLAVGVPWEDVGSIVEAGAVNLIYGWWVGLDDGGNDVWHQNGSQAGAENYFGGALAGGDFDGDGDADLAVGASGEAVGSAVDAGVVRARYFGTGGGISGIQVWYQGSTGLRLAGGESEEPSASPEAVSAGAGAETPAALALLPAAPNPFADRATLRFVLPEAGPVRLVVYDALGRAVAVLVDGAVAAGTHAVVFDPAAARLPSGVYVVRLEAAGRTATQQLTRLR
jgi:hypothetical protein